MTGFVFKGIFKEHFFEQSTTLLDSLVGSFLTICAALTAAVKAPVL